MDNTTYYREKQDEILKCVDKKIAEVNDRMEIVNEEICYLTNEFELAKKIEDKQKVVMVK